MSNIPFQDLGRLHRSIKDELGAAIADIGERSAFVGAAASADFESAFADAHQATHAIGVGSGTDALALALRSAGVGEGDEVIVPSMTFVATAEAVVHAGATPVLADVDPVTLALNADTVAAVRTSRTRAVLPVHLYGTPVPFALLERWRGDGLVVIEDAAQAHLATDGGRSVGSVGNAACFSFYPGKNLGAWGDGGMIITNDGALADLARRLRDHGRASKYSHDLIGYCSRLDGLQAAILLVKLRHLAAWTDERRRLASRYRERLGDRLVPWTEGAVHHLLVMVTDGPAHRDMLQSTLVEASIATGVHYPIALSQQPSCAPWAVSTPVAEQAADRILSLPMDPLMTTAEVDRVCDAIDAS